MKKCGLLGRNISYTKSPYIHNEYYKKNNLHLKYEIFDIDESSIDEFFFQLKNSDIVGFNVTIPYKEKILKYLNNLVYPANIIGAVNAVAVKENSYLGYNTDYFGFIRSLKENNIDVNGKKILILGNGGSAKAVFYALKDLEVKTIDIAGRDLLKIEKEFPLVNNILNISLDLNLYDYDMLINCTPVGNINNPTMNLNIKKINKHLIIYDLNYEPEKTGFIKLGEKLGLRCINGLDMLKFQAYESIKVWKDIMN